MSNLARKACSVIGVVLLAQYVLQLYLIAAAIFLITSANDNQKDIYAAFKQADESFLPAHMGNGDLAGILILTLLVLSFVARYPRRTIGLTALLFVLMVIQASIPHPPVPPLVSAVHGVNALFLIGLTAYLTVSNWAFGRLPRVGPASVRS